MSDAYPANFADWPLDRRNAFFADAARAYDEGRRGSREVEPAHASRFAIIHTAPPPQSEEEYGDVLAPPAPFAGAAPREGPSVVQAPVSLRQRHSPGASPQPSHAVSSSTDATTPASF
jgi:hypothetical protein